MKKIDFFRKQLTLISLLAIVCFKAAGQSVPAPPDAVGVALPASAHTPWLHVDALQPGPKPLALNPKWQMALKTNLLFWAVGAPNLGVEIPIGQRLSVAVDGAYAYWRINNLYALQTIQGGIEGRYWFCPAAGFATGWNIGVYGMYCSRYDVQWKNGWQGDGFWSAGLSGGYSAPISRRLNMEFGLAAGYFFTPEARHYSRPQQGHLIWEETRRNMGRFSLTKVKVSLHWLLEGGSK
ncbi:MAG: DUF3575 domain-containing protein [Rikenellaceae bacterium]|nr:DUF3575 domain-containing protein [Rikenellaceae bacterium]MCL2691951.1 DUF3575 domain-containing protein [Rikenellaceae bacterium]